MNSLDHEPGDACTELRRLIEGLSEAESTRVLALFRDVAAGERYWESEISDYYNERVKLRSLHSNNNSGIAAPGAPQTEHGVFAPIPITKSFRHAERVPLLPAERLDADLSHVLTNRRSCREYAREPITMQQLSSLMHYCCGVTGRSSGYGYNQLPLRTFPSCGGLQVPEVYISVQAVEKLHPGLYHYHSVDHALELMKPGMFGTYLRSVCLGQEQLESASVVFLVTGCFDRLRWKYGERGYRYMCMDIGYLGQNIYVAGNALNLGVCAIAGFMDDAIEMLLSVDGRNETALLLTTVGVPLS
jgi:SagB-type dehydrogenase family enzyme